MSIYTLPGNLEWYIETYICLLQIHRSGPSFHKHAQWLFSSVQYIHFYHLPVLLQALVKKYFYHHLRFI